MTSEAETQPVEDGGGAPWTQLAAVRRHVGSDAEKQPADGLAECSGLYGSSLNLQLGDCSSLAYAKPMPCMPSVPHHVTGPFGVSCCSVVICSLGHSLACDKPMS